MVHLSLKLDPDQKIHVIHAKLDFADPDKSVQENYLFLIEEEKSLSNENDKIPIPQVPPRR